MYNGAIQCACICFDINLIKSVLLECVSHIWFQSPECISLLTHNKHTQTHASMHIYTQRSAQNKIKINVLSFISTEHFCINKNMHLKSHKYNQHSDTWQFWSQTFIVDATPVATTKIIFSLTPRWLHGNPFWSLRSSLCRREPKDQIRNIIKTKQNIRSWECDGEKYFLLNLRMELQGII